MKKKVEDKKNTKFMTNTALKKKGKIYFKLNLFKELILEVKKQ